MRDSTADIAGRLSKMKNKEAVLFDAASSTIKAH